MKELLKKYSGNITVNGADIRSIQLVDGQDITVICSPIARANNTNSERKTSTFDNTKIYQFTVKPYMTKKATLEFDFMDKWNNGTPMPLRTMVGTIEKETKGMIYVNLHGDIISKETQRCMKCGRVINNPVSRYFGMGPECGGHNYINPFYNEDELMAAVGSYREQLRKLTWSGWIIKSAIIEQEEINND